MDSNSASVDRAETVNNKMEEEMDESLLDETEGSQLPRRPLPAPETAATATNQRKVAKVKAQ